MKEGEEREVNEEEGRTKREKIGRRELKERKSSSREKDERRERRVGRDNEGEVEPFSTVGH